MKPTLILLVLASFSQSAPILVVQAGAHNRDQTPVTIALPSEVPENPALKGPGGESLPLQISDDDNATFILPELAAGASVEYELVGLPEAPVEMALAKQEDNKISFSVGGKAVTSFIGIATGLPRQDIPKIYLRGGYLHPLVSPTGNVVTDDYPANHLHHHGVWTAWTNAIFRDRKTDFWNMGDGKGKVDSTATDYSWSGSVHAGVEAENAYTDLTSGEPVLVLNEIWTVKVFAISEGRIPYHLLELTSTQNMADDFDLELPEYHYGGIGIRGLGAWNGAKNASFLTSEGVTDRDQANGKTAKWITMGGQAENGKANIAILGSASNFRAPQPLRVHPTEPFVCFAPQVAGAMKIQHGKDYRSQYRLVITDGEAEKELLDRLWNDYAEPPSADWK